LRGELERGCLDYWLHATISNCILSITVTRNAINIIINNPISAAIRVICQPLSIAIATSRHHLYLWSLAPPAVSKVRRTSSTIFPKAHLLTPNKLKTEALLNRKFQTRQGFEQGARVLLKMGIQSVYIKGGHQFGSAQLETETTNMSTALLPQQDDWALDYLLIYDSLFNFSPKDRPCLCDATESLRGLWLQSPLFFSEDTHGTGCTFSLSLACLLGISEDVHNSNNQPGGAWTNLHVGDASFIVNIHITTYFAASQGKLVRVPCPVSHAEFPSLSLAFPHVWVPQDESSKATKFVPWISDNSQQQSTDLNTVYLIPIVGSVEWIKRLCDIISITNNQFRVQITTSDYTLPSTVWRMFQDSQELCAAANVRLWMNNYWREAIVCQ
jgi:Phosphomethylpyrimidine kinase